MSHVDYDVMIFLLRIDNVIGRIWVMLRNILIILFFKCTRKPPNQYKIVGKNLNDPFMWIFMWGISEPPNQFERGMQESTDRWIEPNFERGMQGSTNGRINSDF